MAEQFTPGPWLYDDEAVQSEGRCIARLDWSIRDARDDANGHLIASAPALYAAGDELADKLWILRCESTDEKSREAAEKALAMWDAARMQARGEA